MVMGQRALVTLIVWCTIQSAACKSGGSAVVVRAPQTAGSATDLPMGVVYLDLADACTPQFVAYGASSAPVWVRSERDFDGDGRADVVIADQTQCDERGNCRWQLFQHQTAACPVYVGELAGATLAIVESDEKPMRLQGIWYLADNRVLRHEYRMVDGRYELSSATVCRLDADVVQCAALPDSGH